MIVLLNMIFVVCQAGWSAFNGKCYKSFTEVKTWEDAEDQCVNEEVRVRDDKTISDL